MIHYHFSCTLRSDVIISSSSATEGFRPSLDYISGAKFWGIAATHLYARQEPQETLDLFHNGEICFGDAHLEINGKRSHKIPLSWLRDKHKPEAGVYIYHAVNYRELLSTGVQPEPLPGDYFNAAGEYRKPLQDFAIKSAYDSENRRSADEKMYGYYALPAGSRWQFRVSSHSKALLEKVKAVLEGTRHIGRSRSAQYGLATISFEGTQTQQAQTLPAGTHYLYADSALMLPPEVPLSEALPGAEIDFGKSKIRTRIYQSWNTHRHTRDADRQVIEKGSVIVVTLAAETPATKLLQHLQERRAEGFGEVWIDPPFLTQTIEGHFATPALKEWKAPKEEKGKGYTQYGGEDTLLLAALKKRQEDKAQQQSIGAAVNTFVNNPANKKLFRGVTASQWGTVRAMAKLFSGTKLHEQLFAPGTNNEKKGYLVSGIAEDKWRAGRQIIEDIVTDKGDYPKPRHLFLEKLAAEMAKCIREQEFQTS